MAEVALAHQFGISYDTYNLVADPEVRHSITPKRVIKFTDFLQAIGVMKSTSKSWKDLVFPELHGGQAAERPGGPSTSTLLKEQV